MPSNTIITSSYVFTSNNRRYAYFEHSGSSQIFNNSEEKQVFINGQSDIIQGGLANLWNTGSSVFQPLVVGSVYNILFEGVISPSTGNPTFHLDLKHSGSVEEFGKTHQGTEFFVRNSGLNQHIHSTFNVIVTPELVISGAIFTAASSGNNISLISASCWIKED